MQLLCEQLWSLHTAGDYPLSNPTPGYVTLSCISGSPHVTAVSWPAFSHTLPTCYPSVLGSVLAVRKRFLEGGFTLSLPCSLSAALVMPGKNIGISGYQSEEPSPAVSWLRSVPGSSATACALQWGQMGRNKDHSQRPHIFP